jgi:hypothetical protein
MHSALAYHLPALKAGLRPPALRKGLGREEQGGLLRSGLSHPTRLPLHAPETLPPKARAVSKRTVQAT